MPFSPTPWLALVGAAFALPSLAAAPVLDGPRLDAVFARINDTNPGCALGITHEGRSVYAKGYGLADLNHGVPIRPDTVFDIGSTSKQFTALALLLLEREGKLKLDDPLSQHLPDVAKRFKAPITLRQLLGHTAGLPDYTVLMSLAGHAEEDVTGNAEALRAIEAAPDLNFQPGSRFSYSNTGYFLASLVAERAAGQSLDAYLQGKVFKPLGMNATHVRTDHTQVVPQRASAYAAVDEGKTWRIQMSNWNQAGDGAVQSTVLDLGRWDAEMASPKVLPPEVVQAMRTVGTLSDGRPTGYGQGQFVDSLRGQPRVLHAGAWAGYRAITVHFPQQKLGLALLCNHAEANTPMLANRVSEVLLQGQLEPPSNASAPEAAGVDLKPFEGRYLSIEQGLLLSVQPDARRPGHLDMRVGPGGAPLKAIGPRELQTLSGGATLSLSADGRELLLARRQDGSRTPYTRLAAFTPGRDDTQRWAGSYRQAGLNAQWTLQPQPDGSLRVQARGMENEPPLQLVAPNLAVGSGVLLELQRDTAGRVTGFTYRNDRVRAVHFMRLAR